MPARTSEAPVHVRLSAEPLSVDRVLAAVTTPRTGGVGLFVGLVRDHDGPGTDGADRGAVTALDYTAHPSAERSLAECASRVLTGATGDDPVLTVAVEHRVGHLVVGDLAVVVAVGAAHRAAALDGARRLIDAVKATVPIWKEQSFADGAVEWVGLP